MYYVVKADGYNGMQLGQPYADEAEARREAAKLADDHRCGTMVLLKVHEGRPSADDLWGRFQTLPEPERAALREKLLSC